MESAKDKSRERKHECYTCGKKFPNSGNMFRHIRTVHRAPGPKFHCCFCPAVYMEKDQLCAHIRETHSAIVPPPQEPSVIGDVPQSPKEEDVISLHAEGPVTDDDPEPPRTPIKLIIARHGGGKDIRRCQ